MYSANVKLSRCYFVPFSVKLPSYIVCLLESDKYRKKFDKYILDRFYG